MKFKVLSILVLSGLSGCASMGTTSAQMESLTTNLKYPTEPSNSEVITESSKIIKIALKDPDSLKNLSVTRKDKCTFAEQNLSGNITPRNMSGQLCYQLGYQATNSYGGFVRGQEFIVYSAEMGFSLLTPEQGLIVSSNLSFRYDSSNPFLLPPGQK